MEENNEKNEEKRSNKKLILIEVVIALIAIAIIVGAVILNKNKNKAASVSGTDAANTTLVSGGDALSVSVDNSALYENAPAIPDTASMNTITAEEAEKQAAEGNMMKLSYDGHDIYIGNYENKEKFAASVSIDEAVIDEYIKSDILSSYSEDVPADHDTAQMYDTVSINYVGKMDGAEFKNGSANDQTVTIGVSTYIDGLLEGVIGMKEGETKDVEVTFPDPYYTDPDYSGKDAVFTITLNSIISSMKVPEELTDEMAQEVTGGVCATAKDLKDLIRKNMASEKIWNYIEKDFYVSSVPEDMVMDYYNSSLKQYEATSESYGVSVEDMISSYGSTLDELKQSAMEYAAQSARYVLMYNAIAEKENITYTDEDLQAFAEENGFTDLESFYEAYGENTVKDYVLQSKIMEFLQSIQ